MPTKLKHKLSLIFLGVLFALVLLESGLRLAGTIVLYLQERYNQVSYASNEYRILCLGESTTALGGEDSYPSQLEAMLNAGHPGIKFTVINKGLISTTTEYILSHLDKNLDIYKPQLVILMMGVNDAVYLHGHKALWLENMKAGLQDFRVYKLVHLLYQHITHRIKESKTSPEMLNPPEDNPQQIENFLEILVSNLIKQYQDHVTALAKFHQNGQMLQARQEEDSAKKDLLAASLACIQLAERYRMEARLPDAQKTLEMATYLNPRDADIYVEWGNFYLSQGKYLPSEKSFQLALALDPAKSEAFAGLAHAYYQEHKPEALAVYAQYLVTQPQDYWARIELAQWLKDAGRDDLAEAYLNQAIKINPGLDQAYAEMGQLYRKAGKEDLAKGYFLKAAKHETYGYSPVTFVNFALAVNKILSRKIKVIVMQYPLRDIGPLKDYIGQKNALTFVENKQNFKEAVAGQDYNYYFKDNFAYNFGHCTRAGNELIAKNLAKEIK